MTMLEEIFNLIEKHQLEIKKFGVQKLGIFGSIARGDASPDSDIDFLVELENETFRAYMGLKFYLEDLIGRKVDLVLPDTIKPSLRDSIMNEVKYAAAI